MRSVMLACLVALSALVAGCAKPAATQTEDPAATPVDPSAGPTGNTTTPASPSPSSSNGTTPGPSSTPGATTPNATTPKNDSLSPVPPGPGWASVDAAKIRPGMQVITAGDPRSATTQPGTGRECTSNFVYTSADNTSLYLGIAAHCVSGLKIGDGADIGPGVAKGTIAYSSWFAMNNSQIPDDPTSPAACANEKDATTCDANDFALIRIDPAMRASVNPAMLHFGGPIDLAKSAAVKQLDKVITYGNSDLRQGVEPYQEKEGYVSEPGAWTTIILTQFPGLPGDSGSGVLTGDGRALGILVTGTLYSTNPFNPTGASGVTNLDMALSYARAHGFDARLATWPLLNAGALPPV